MGLLEKTEAERWHTNICHLIFQKLGRKHSLRVLDFGGGDGLHYLKAKPTLFHYGCGCFNPYAHKRKGLEWNIVEFQECVDKYKDSMPDEPQLKWFSSMDELDGKMDIVYSDSTLRYIENYQDALSKMMSFNPWYIFLHRSTIGQHNTCLGRQLFGRQRLNGPDVEFGDESLYSFEPGQADEDNYGMTRNGEAMHFWFINEESFRQHIDSHGYQIFHKQAFNIHPRYEIVEGSLNSYNDYWGTPRAEINSFILEKTNQC